MTTESAGPGVGRSFVTWLLVLGFSVGLLVALAASDKWLHERAWGDKLAAHERDALKRKDGLKLSWTECNLISPSTSLATSGSMVDGGPCGQGTLQVTQRRQSNSFAARPENPTKTAGQVPPAKLMTTASTEKPAGNSLPVVTSPKPPSEDVIETVTEWRFPSIQELRSMEALNNAVAAFDEENGKPQAVKILDATSSALTTLGVFGVVLSGVLVFLALLKRLGLSLDPVPAATKIIGAQQSEKDEKTPPSAVMAVALVPAFLALLPLLAGITAALLVAVSTWRSLQPPTPDSFATLVTPLMEKAKTGDEQVRRINENFAALDQEAQTHIATLVATTDQAIKAAATISKSAVETASWMRDETHELKIATKEAAELGVDAMQDAANILVDTFHSHEDMLVRQGHELDDHSFALAGHATLLALHALALCEHDDWLVDLDVHRVGGRAATSYGEMNASPRSDVFVGSDPRATHRARFEEPCVNYE